MLRTLGFAVSAVTIHKRRVCAVYSAGMVIYEKKTNSHSLLMNIRMKVEI